MRIILLGPPGAGKGTQAKTLAKKLRLIHISTGDLLRQNVSEGTGIGRQAKDFMNKGLLVPDELVTQMLVARIGQPDAKNGFILDGYPRNIKQAAALDELLKEKNRDIDYALELDTSEAVIIQRLSGRLACSHCNANFHVKNMPPKKDLVCDNCGGKLYQRQDDTSQTIKKRLEVYREDSLALVKYYQAKQKLYRVLADEEPEIVLNKIMRFLKGAR